MVDSRTSLTPPRALRLSFCCVLLVLRAATVTTTTTATRGTSAVQPFDEAAYSTITSLLSPAVIKVDLATTQQPCSFCASLDEFWDKMAESKPGAFWHVECERQPRVCVHLFQSETLPTAQPRIFFAWTASTGQFVPFTGARSLDGLMQWAGAHVMKPVNPPPWPSAWPAVIHSTFKTQDRSRWMPEWIRADATWRALYPAPQYTHMFWSDEANERAVRSELPQFARFWEGVACYERAHIIRADFSMMVAQFLHGGVYHDLDVLAVHHVDQLRPLLPPRAAVVLSRATFSELAYVGWYIEKETVLSLQSRHPFWLFCMTRTAEALGKDPQCRRSVSYVAGTNNLRTCVDAWWREHPERRHEVVVLPAMAFHPLEAAVRSLGPGQPVPSTTYASFVLRDGGGDLEEPFDGLESCFLIRNVARLDARPLSRGYFHRQPRCAHVAKEWGKRRRSEAEEEEEAHELRADLDACYDELWDACGTSLAGLRSGDRRALGPFSCTLSSGSWSNVCTQEVRFGEDKDRSLAAQRRATCAEAFRSREFRRLNILLAVADDEEHAMQLALTLEGLPQLCALTLVQFVRQETEQAGMPWPTLGTISKCLRNIAQRGLERQMPAWARALKRLVQARRPGKLVEKMLDVGVDGDGDDGPAVGGGGGGDAAEKVEL